MYIKNAIILILYMKCICHLKITRNCLNATDDVTEWEFATEIS